MHRVILLLLPGVISLGAAFKGEIASFRLKNLDNKSVAYSDLKGEKLTVIDFWATWCKPCVRSIPKLEKIYQRYKDEGVQFIGISVDGPRNLPKVKPMAKSLGITYPVLLDVNSKIMKQMKVTLIPSIIVVDEKDEIVSFHQGYRPGDEKVLEKEIAEWLKTKAGEVDEEK